jgi:hypothetical protein
VSCIRAEVYEISSAGGDKSFKEIGCLQTHDVNSDEGKGVRDPAHIVWRKMADLP